MDFDGVWTLYFAAGNADNEFRSFAQEVVVAMEEVKRRSSAETALWENTIVSSPSARNAQRRNMSRLRRENAIYPLWSCHVLSKMRLKKRDFFTSPAENKIKNPKVIFSQEKNIFYDFKVLFLRWCWLSRLLPVLTKKLNIPPVAFTFQ